jgi:hypothetical protein
MTRHLFVVSRHHADLWQYLRDHFATEPDVEVILDRRRGERRRHAAAIGADRRARDRRSRRYVDAALRSESHAFLTIR